MSVIDQAVRVVDALWARPELFEWVLIELEKRGDRLAGEWELADAENDGVAMWRRWAKGEEVATLRCEDGLWTGSVVGEEGEPVVVVDVGPEIEVVAGMVDALLISLSYRIRSYVPTPVQLHPWERMPMTETGEIFRTGPAGCVARVWKEDGEYRAQIGRGEEPLHIRGPHKEGLARRVDKELKKRGFEVDEWLDLPDWGGP
jgi:hypothetical protein